jgi:hypothetical protein
LNLRVTYSDREVEITGEVPVEGAAAQKNCYSAVKGYSNSFASIPFTIKRQVA